jgi:alpha-N-arabinofuranosidase
MQWSFNLIGYDALNSYGSPAYYAQKMFSLHKGDTVLGISAQNLPTRSAPAGRGGGTRQVKSLFYSATRDTASGKITVKIVNSADTPQDVKIEVNGVKSVSSKGTAIVLKAAKRDETNSIKDPNHVVPATEKVKDLGASFTRTFPPCSITVLELKAK